MGQGEQKGMTLFLAMSEVWCQKELSQVGGREALMRVHKQMIVVTDQMHQKHRRKRWNHKVGKLQESCKAGSALLFEWIRNESRPQTRVLQKEIHEVIARAQQDIFRRWDKEEKPTWQNLEELPTPVGHATTDGIG